jgi:hypothetical protein
MTESCTVFRYRAIPVLLAFLDLDKSRDELETLQAGTPREILGRM